MTKILLVDDEEIIHQTLGDYLCELGYHVDHAYQGLGALELVQSQVYDIALLDIKMPQMNGLTLLRKIHELCPVLPVVLITGHGTMEIVIEALRIGAADFLTKPVKLLELEATLEKCFYLHALLKEKQTLRGVINTLQASYLETHPLVGNSAAIQVIRQQIHQAVNASCEMILITGETGTGKEIIARQIHHLSKDRENPFIAVSCPSLSESLFESELFGHVKGAFTGATQEKAGYFELADGGTLFLDEIGDLSAGVQAKLLRALETRIIRRVGGTEEIQVKIRVIAATNANLETLIKTARFRPDLYYRLDHYSIHVPPLSERQEDILPLAEHFLYLYAKGRNHHIEGFSPDAKQKLLEYDFPGNVRELRNIVERAAMLNVSGTIQAKQLLVDTLTNSPRLSSEASQDQEREYLLTALENAKWNRRQAAKELGLPYSTLRYKMEKLNIR
ncbi:sigma-54 dependent transcriptional regulator [Deltaproteobacteria bacterium TL4]